MKLPAFQAFLIGLVAGWLLWFGSVFYGLGMHVFATVGLLLGLVGAAALVALVAYTQPRFRWIWPLAGGFAVGVLLALPTVPLLIGVG